MVIRGIYKSEETVIHNIYSQDKTEFLTKILFKILIWQLLIMELVVFQIFGVIKWSCRKIKASERMHFGLH